MSHYKPINPVMNQANMLRHVEAGEHLIQKYRAEQLPYHQTVPFIENSLNSIYV